MDSDLCSNLCQVLGVAGGLGTGKYLGLPSILGCNIKTILTILKVEFGRKSILDKVELYHKLVGGAC